MPITYKVSENGHFIYAVASGMVTEEEFVNYEIEHANDLNIESPVAELFVIQSGSCENMTLESCEKVIEKRKEIEAKPTRHNCAIVLSYGDRHAWDLAKFYEGMVNLHFPKNVIVFGDERIARTWLGVKSD